MASSESHVTPFFDSLPAGGSLDELLDPAAFRPAPPDWWVFLTDVADSTAAIRAGRYREVNFLGAACIAAVLNACGRPNLPYAFGGDGAVILVPPSLHGTARDALIAVSGLARNASGFHLRAGAIPVAECAGQDRGLGVARLQLAPGVDLALFSGGGLMEADRLIKTEPARCFPIPSNSPPPDLQGLSCRWEPLISQRGAMLSLLVLPRTKPGERLCRELYRALREASGAHPPVGEHNLRLRLRSKGAALERRLISAGWRGWIAAAKATAQLAATWIALRMGRNFGPFNPDRYRAETVRQTDSVKYDGMLRMVIDAAPDEESRILDLLAAAHGRGEVFYGTQRSATALITCWVPAVFEGVHLHFIDGADGGYALAARNLKDQMRGGDDRD